MEKLTDEDLMGLLRRGDVKALEELYGRYAGKLHAFCSSARPGRDRSESEDMVQDIFLKVIRSARTFDSRKASFRTWLFTVARNHCVDAARRDRIARIVPIVVAGDSGGREGPGVREEDIEDPAEDPETSAVRSSVVDAVQDCIDALESEDERQAVTLYYLSGSVLREVGAILGRSTSAAKNLVDSAKAKLKECLERKGVDRI